MAALTSGTSMATEPPSTTPSDAARDGWDRHWNDFTDAATLNPAQSYRRKLLFEALALERAPHPVRLLDLGSGNGDFALEVARARPDTDILGLDLSASGAAMAKEKVPGGAFFQRDFTRPLELGDRYRAWATHAVCSEVLEHLDDPVAMLRNVRTAFAPGCRVVVTVPGGPMSAFDKHIGHRRHFDEALLERTLGDAGLEVVEFWGAGFPFFNLYRLAVIARGQRLIDDAGGNDPSRLPLKARAAIRMFSWLFALNVRKPSLGWQLVAVAAEPR
jgi:SAM-dependent methyltransferase